MIIEAGRLCSRRLNARTFRHKWNQTSNVSLTQSPDVNRAQNQSVETPAWQPYRQEPPGNSHTAMESILCACVVRLVRVALHAGRTDRLLHQGGDGSIWTAFITNLCGIYYINMVDVLPVLQLSPPPRVVLLRRNGTPGIWIILKNFPSYQTTISLNLEQFNAHLKEVDRVIRRLQENGPEVIKAIRYHPQ